MAKIDETYVSKRVALNNLGTEMTGEIRNDMMRLELLNVPISSVLGNNYESLGTLDVLKKIDEETKSKNNMGGKITHENSIIKNRGIEAEQKGETLSLMLGQSSVINPPWQFNELDDVRSNPDYPHMGRVYLNYIYFNQPIVVFQPCREKYNVNAMSFFFKNLGTEHKVLNKYIRSGGQPGLLGALRHGLIAVKNTLLAGIDCVLQLAGLNTARADKFVLFKPAMRLYRKMVNGLLREMAGNMGLIDLSGESGGNVPDFNIEDDLDFDPTEGDKSTDSTTLGGIVKNLTDGLEDIYDKYSSTYRGSINKLDIIEMIPGSNYSSDPGLGAMEDYQNKSYIPFMCQNNITVSETFTNSTQTHPLIEQLNSLSQENKMNNEYGNAKIFSDAVAEAGGANIFESGYNALKKVGEGLAVKATGEMANSVGEMGMILNGDGRMLVPDVWASSGYSRNYSVDFKFFSPLGDTVSVFENEYIQLAILMTMTAPIQTGKIMYMSPFSVKVFSKGLFSVENGIIESMTVTRGEEKNDRTRWGYPRTMKISLSIKDLQPAMMLSLGGSAFWKYRKANSSLTEYISTLCCLSISDRLNLAKKFKKSFAIIATEFRDTLSLENLGYNFSNSAIMKPAAWWSRPKITVDSVRKKNITGY